MTYAELMQHVAAQRPAVLSVPFDGEKQAFEFRLREAGRASALRDVTLATLRDAGDRMARAAEELAQLAADYRLLGR